MKGEDAAASNAKVGRAVLSPPRLADPRAHWHPDGALQTGAPYHRPCLTHF